MLCGKCQDDNLPDAAFCSECGAKLEAVCPSCGLGNYLARSSAAIVAQGSRQQERVLPAWPNMTNLTRVGARTPTTYRHVLRSSRLDVALGAAGPRGDLRPRRTRNGEETRRSCLFNGSGSANCCWLCVFSPRICIPHDSF